LKLKNFKKLKKIKKKLETDMWHVRFKIFNYLNTISENEQIDHNLTKI